MSEAEQIDAMVPRALRVLSELLRGNPPAADEWSEGLISALAPVLPAASSTSDLISTHAIGPGVRWHAEQLVPLGRASAGESPSDRARRIYHARMTGHCLAPNDADFRPLVTILIPVFNRAGPLVEAVESCFRQTWRPIEILVVDDGSSDDPARALSRFGSEVRLHRRMHAGVAAARNFGVRQATGDFIHFLDSDDLLLPSAVESKLDAFRIIADADVCYGQSQWTDMRVSPPAVAERRLKILEDSQRSMIVAFPFLLQAAMMPRWRLLAGPSFEEDLRRSSDFRYWQSLGFAEAKVIGSRTFGTQLRRFHDSLHLSPEREDDSHAVALMRGLRDLARHPRAWRHGPAYLNILCAQRVQYWLAEARSERVRRESFEAVAALKRAATRSPSPLPMLAAMSARCRRLARDAQWLDASSESIYRLLTDAFDHCRASARPLDDGDLEFWSDALTSPPSDTPLARFFQALGKYCLLSRRASFADALLRRCPRVPRPSLVRRAARWERLLGSGIAARLAAHRMTRQKA